MRSGSDGDKHLSRDMEILRDSKLFDVDYYLSNNADVKASDMDPLAHFCKYGWLELRSPHPDFDVWWYWVNYLDPGKDDINPLVHHALVGQDAGHQGKPSPIRTGSGLTYPIDHSVRRVCLFAGFDRDGVIDESVIAYLHELSAFADVYYLADCFMEQSELAKITGIVKKAWAIRHGAYDFGSYSLMARDLVGWEVIDSYDELMLVNDSCYLLRPLEQVFERMDSASCDWWGLQATKGIAATRNVASNAFSDKIPITHVKRDLLASFANDYLYDFLVGSYFLVYRRPVIEDSGFRRLLDTVQPSQSKLKIIQKYEIGITHYLIGSGFDFDTFIHDLHPFHPLFTATYFNLLAEGLPILKKYFIYQNHYDTPGLVAWKERVLELVPEAPVEMFERNLLRTAPDDRLRRSFSIMTDDEGSVVVPRMLSSAEFIEEDKWAPKFDHWWAFPVCAYDHTLAGNDRAVFEAVREDPSIKKIVLTRSRRVEVDGENVIVVPLASPEGQQYLLRAGQIFVKHAPRLNVPYPLSPQTHNFINLWHGIPLKRFGYASVDTPARQQAVAENRLCRAVVTSSRIDTMAMNVAFHPLGYEHMWPTGLPRNDFILCSDARLPKDMRTEQVQLRDLIGDRLLVLFLPTFKDAQADSYYAFDTDELKWLRDWCERHNAVLGVREHMADTSATYTRALSAIGAINLSVARFPNVEVLYRVGSALITDYSSSLIDFTLTGRPVISFAYDHDRYAEEERGLFYDLDAVLPGPVCRNFDQLTTALDHLFQPLSEHPTRVYARRRGLFFDHIDDQNSDRVVHRVKGLYTLETT